MTRGGASSPSPIRGGPAAPLTRAADPVRSFPCPTPRHQLCAGRNCTTSAAGVAPAGVVPAAGTPAAPPAPACPTSTAATSCPMGFAGEPAFAKYFQKDFTATGVPVAQVIPGGHFCLSYQVSCKGGAGDDAGGANNAIPPAPDVGMPPFSPPPAPPPGLGLDAICAKTGYLTAYSYYPLFRCESGLPGLVSSLTNVQVSAR